MPEPDTSSPSMGRVLEFAPDDPADVACRAAIAGDPAAFHALVNRYGPELFRLALSLSGHRADAEDLCQETFVAAFRGIRSFGGRSSLKTWLTRILMRRASRLWKRRRRARDTISIEQADQLSIDASTATTNRRLDVLEVVRTLPPEFRDAIVLRELEGLSYQEIADVLGVPRGTVESRLFRARALLRERLTGY